MHNFLIRFVYYMIRWRGNFLWKLSLKTCIFQLPCRLSESLNCHSACQSPFLCHRGKFSGFLTLKSGGSDEQFLSLTSCFLGRVTVSVSAIEHICSVAPQSCILDQGVEVYFCFLLFYVSWIRGWIRVLLKKGF